MKIYRAIGEKEKLSLIEKNDIIFPHKTCIKEDWILNPHSEDYQTGKFFFFTMEDALLYAKKEYVAYSKEVSIFEMDIDENLIFPYLAYGVYYYYDYDEKHGYCHQDVFHSTPELLLPYKFVENNINNRNFRLLEFNNDDYYNWGKYDPHKFNPPTNSLRPRSFVEMGKVLYNLKTSERSMNWHRSELEKYDNDYDRKRLKEEKDKHETYKSILPKTFQQFMTDMKKYEWQDFRLDNSKDFIPQIKTPTEPEREI